MKSGSRRKTKAAGKHEAFQFAGRCMTTGKVIFANRKAAKQNRKHYQSDVHLYSCLHCGGIHLGHPGEYDRGEHRAYSAKRADRLLADSNSRDR